MYLEQRMEALEKLVETLSSSIGRQAECIEQHANLISGAKVATEHHTQVLSNHSGALAKLERTAKDADQRLTAHDRQLANITSILGDLQRPTTDVGGAPAADLSLQDVLQAVGGVTLDNTNLLQALVTTVQAIGEAVQKQSAAQDALTKLVSARATLVR